MECRRDLCRREAKWDSLGDIAGYHNEQSLRGKKSAIVVKGEPSEESRKGKRAEDQPGKNETRQQAIAVVKETMDDKRSKREAKTINTNSEYGG